MTSSQFLYRAYGLTIGSDFALAEASAEPAGKAEVSINEKAIGIPPLSNGEFRNYRIVPEGDLLEFADVGQFLIRDFCTIDVSLDPKFDRSLIGLPLLGPVMSLLLHRRGLLVLHGSAVLIDGEAHVFLGDKGAGKSTTAAALVASGCPLVADDVVAIEQQASGRLSVRPGFPTMKLERTAIDRFEPGSCKILMPDDGAYTDGKSRVRFHQAVQGRSVPLGRVHCLARGKQNALEALPDEGRLHALIRFAHYPRLGANAVSPRESAALFRLAGALAPQIEVGALVVKHGVADLVELRSFLTGRDHVRRCA